MTKKSKGRESMTIMKNIGMITMGLRFTFAGLSPCAAQSDLNPPAGGSEKGYVSSVTVLPEYAVWSTPPVNKEMVE